MNQQNGDNQTQGNVLGTQQPQQGQNGDQGQGQQQQLQGNNQNADPNWQPGQTGAVIDPENDGRLTENREQGRTKGTTEHSSQAPNVDQDNSGSVNNRQ